MANESDTTSAWTAALEMQMDPEGGDETKIALYAHGATEEAAKAAVAEVLHEEIFSKPISQNINENLNDYDSPLGFLDSIQREHDQPDRPDSYTAALIWEALYDALQTLRVQPPRLQLYYFALLAKGLGPALVLEHSGLAWVGNRDLPFSIAADWKALKPTTPFGQLPLLKAAGVSIAQTCAIINYVGRLAGTEGATSALYGWSQMLLAEAEDICTEMNRFLPTLYKRLSSDGITTSKGGLSDYCAFWSTRLPAHLERLERLMAERGAAEGEPPTKKPRVANGAGVSSGDDDSGVAQPRAYLPGELYLFSILYQAFLVEPTCLQPHATLCAWFDAIKADPRTHRVISGKSTMGELEQYYQAADSKDVCRDADERGRWG